MFHAAASRNTQSHAGWLSDFDNSNSKPKRLFPPTGLVLSAPDFKSKLTIDNLEFWLSSHCNAIFSSQITRHREQKSGLPNTAFVAVLLLLYPLAPLRSSYTGKASRATECRIRILVYRSLQHACARRPPFCGLAASSRSHCITFVAGLSTR
jgi:hypothetical protein